jgi:endoribonuclease LACTB2
MVVTARVSIVNVGYRSTNFWIVSSGTSRLMVDLGWPGTIGTMRANLERMGVPLNEIRHGLATHFHLDHAGLAQDLKLLGMRLLVPDVQRELLPHIADHVKPADGFTPITTHDNVYFPLDRSREILAGIGIDGDIVHTPGHSDDSVSLLLDDGSVFTGDLTHPMFATEETMDAVTASWQALIHRGATTVYPGHGAIRAIAGGETAGA